MTRIGVMLDHEVPPAEVRPFARMVEERGYDELWVVEDCFWTGGVANAALALAATERIAVGIGVLPAVLRNTAVAAMELATLAGAFPGRLIAGLGHGVADWMRQVGAYPRSPLAALELAMRETRALLDGERLDREGMRDVALEFPLAEPPRLLAGLTGPKGLALAGRAGDGAVLPGQSSAAFVRESRAHVAAAMGAGREPEIVVYAVLSVDADGAAARAALRPSIAEWLGDNRGRPQQLATSFAGALPADGPVAPELVRDEWIDELAVAGTPADCRAAVRRLADAGADAVVLIPVDAEQLALVPPAALR
jgi:alkanesulfonate monooxygenase SsuD/methylene tetrahydromethanopterin reductase-like flavin-dependent oxidoreductase (luciferase family)